MFEHVYVRNVAIKVKKCITEYSKAISYSRANTVESDDGITGAGENGPNCRRRDTGVWVESRGPWQEP